MIQDALENEIKDFNQDLPKNKEEIVSELPDFEVKSKSGKSDNVDEWNRFLNKGFDTLGKMLDDGPDDILN
jgi:hypothetical protein